MAAGMGSRFGSGIKQLAEVGPSGEIIMDYSIYAAKEAGFDKVDNNKVLTYTNNTALIRVSLNLSINIDTMASVKEIELVKAAKNTKTKNAPPITLPKGIWSKTIGKVLNIKPAPPVFNPSSPLKI